MSRPKIKIEDLFELPTAEIFNPDSFSSSSFVSTDTRTIKKNSIFVALKGKKFDGHLFVEEAVKKGASVVVVNKKRLKDFDNVNVTIVTVKDTTKAYGDIAKIWHSKLNAKIVAISGSNGKTSTKEILTGILSEKFKVTRTLANNNNHIGVPLTILETGSDTEVLVLELGTNHFGEIAYTSQIAKPEFALITNIGESHLEFLQDLEGVAKEKISLFDETAKNGGIIFLNTDDKILKKKAKNYKNLVSFGFNDKAEVKGKIIDLKDGKTIVQVTYKDKSFKVNLPVYGLTNAKNFLASAAIALKLGMSFKQIKQGAESLSSVKNRLNVKNFDKFSLVNDTYNANPLSMRSAFEFIGSFQNRKRKIVVLGDMFELGKQASSAHKELADSLKKNKITEVYTIGKLMRLLNNELVDKKITAKHFTNRDKLGAFLSDYNFDDSVVLFKGSRGMKMEEFVKVIDKEM
ncbi:MAG: UDP-N-acetylmuramoyl-tripeptide--D-alanyl-D-alanine ligase [Bacteroidota bacterium]|nr:UDP-N-acetylmuramoyl-tripeptide--D-alanyl-D-alanine ligase [Bacteroidota bacterium]MDP4191800.1 UDP-N-acetylmuramoyl-tripeptide--D-alanyl-D-alanine ligase [Bacteroidota bacterium]MDP4195728.1 UDP-N-acetylmuramoyl-tripeptide--D-alanyl-D-alanine ligase [Bacteroidota bacterium]